MIVQNGGCLCVAYLAAAPTLHSSTEVRNVGSLKIFIKSVKALENETLDNTAWLARAFTGFCPFGALTVIALIKGVTTFPRLSLSSDRSSSIRVV